VFEVFKKWLLKSKSGRTLKCLKSDNGGEYCVADSNSSVQIWEFKERKQFPKTLIKMEWWSV